MRLFLIPLLLATLGNADVVKLVKAGLSAETIEAKITSSSTDFDTSIDALVALAEQGVPDRVIRAMIERDRIAPVPPTPPTPPVPPVAPQPIGRRRYDVTLHNDQGGKCVGEVTVDSRGIKASRCRDLDFDLRWSELESVCYTYGFRGELTVKTKDRERKLSVTTPAEAKRLVERIGAVAPRLRVAECR